MTGYYGKQKILARDKTVSMGIDVHKEHWHVTVLVAGEELFQGQIPGEYAALRKLLARLLDCQIRVAYEAGPCGFGLHDRLQADGVEVLVVPPSLIPYGNSKRADPVPDVPFPVRKFPSHVYQQAGILLAYLQQLAQQVEANPTWLSPQEQLK